MPIYTLQKPNASKPIANNRDPIIRIAKYGRTKSKRSHWTMRLSKRAMSCLGPIPPDVTLPIYVVYKTEQPTLEGLRVRGLAKTVPEIRGNYWLVNINRRTAHSTAVSAILGEGDFKLEEDTDLELRHHAKGLGLDDRRWYRFVRV